MTDITKTKVTTGVFAAIISASLCFAGKAGFVVSEQLAEIKYEQMRTREQLLAFDMKLDLYNAQSWTWLMEQRAWEMAILPSASKPDIRQIWKDYSK